ncbi:cytosol aminopeptidase family, catalytic domain-containing protein [Cokeromyces recurvatus]|uniref:cytosol aminopeptidase family, catalytic domain-containing protein n=1 Tax=Cokeromyces recurvatus TaxID=90255 RepID=UPI00221F5BF6|nr:cytosol aminopeptidase family, catalytic domain-containing protein [Cokeromyces recurvatus]KAI7905868.1 cytosol aminopeptidase family, catalytic domain-containing protein [Cokeromyces recurvatus]
MFSTLKPNIIRISSKSGRRLFSNKQGFDSLVMGVYTTTTDLTSPLLTTQQVSNKTRQVIQQQLAGSNFKNAGDIRMLYNVGGIKQLAVVSLGENSTKKNEYEQQENVRMATAIGLQALQKQGAKYTGVDVSVDIQAAAEGAVLGQFSFDKLKKNQEKEEKRVMPYLTDESPSAQKSWETGQIYGASQNVARMLMTTPANLMTPKLFTEEVAYLLAGLENIDIEVHGEEWVSRQKMNAFLSVAKGSVEPLRFLEIHYKGAANKDERPFGLVGKGITFDSGGISLKPSANMALMKGDMGGAAVSCAALFGIAKMKLPVNIVAVIPLCENMPSGKATKPGDVVKAMNGKSIEVLNTDAEGRLILADALHYISSRFHPKHVIDLATLTGAMDVALGQVYTGVFTNSDSLWKQLKKAGEITSDPFWRMPLHDDYVYDIKQSLVADLSNVASNRSAGSCVAAGFLREFIEKDIPWAHIDIAGVMDCPSSKGHHIKGMSGRPTRAIIELMKGIHS